MVTIEVVRLSVHAFHGVGEQERRVGNDFEVSVSLDYPPAEKAVVTDDLDSTLDYGELIEIIRNVMAIPSRLLEHVCGRLKDAVLERFPAVSGGKIKIAKLLPPVPGTQLGEAAVILVW